MQYSIHKLGFTPDNIVMYAWSIGGYPATWAAMNYPDIKAVVSIYKLSVVPRARHCGILAILPPMSLKIAPSADLRAHLENLLTFTLFITISVFSVT